MIGVVCKPTETAAVEEFFQLFKTPWEFLQQGRSYDVVISTAGEIPTTDAKVLLMYGVASTGANNGDHRQPGEVMLNFQGTTLPVYGAVRILGEAGKPVLTVSSGAEVVGARLSSGGSAQYRFGYDLFQEIAFLLTTGQPVHQARVPAVELHIAILRSCLLAEGITFVEIPPVPAGYEFLVCLTHDIDFVGIRMHRFDHTMWGFLYRSSVGAIREFLRGRIALSRLARMWRAAASLPFVYLGWLRDFWLPFEWYLKVEKDLSPTYFLIPFKNRAGDKLSGSHAKRRATAYDITDLAEWTRRLLEEGCEIGVHGIDAWHDVEKGSRELERVVGMTGRTEMGVRIHWLLRNENTYRVLEEAGYSYDSTAGYNETIGYRCGTTQTFRPLGTRRLLELPLHIQDGALFFPQRLDLSEAEAWQRCEEIVANAKAFGGVLTILWHDRSPGPERFWGDFYARLVQDLKSRSVWFASGGQAVNWFRTRREVVFERAGETVRVKRSSADTTALPPMTLRIHRPDGDRTTSAGQPKVGGRALDFWWTDGAEIELDGLLRGAYRPASEAGCTVAERV